VLAGRFDEHVDKRPLSCDTATLTDIDFALQRPPSAIDTRYQRDFGAQVYFVHEAPKNASKKDTSYFTQFETTEASPSSNDSKFNDAIE
jgi:hypothetical protein